MRITKNAFFSILNCPRITEQTTHTHIQPLNQGRPTIVFLECLIMCHTTPHPFPFLPTDSSRPSFGETCSYRREHFPTGQKGHASLKKVAALEQKPRKHRENGTEIIRGLERPQGRMHFAFVLRKSIFECHNQHKKRRRKNIHPPAIGKGETNHKFPFTSLVFMFYNSFSG